MTGEKKATAIEDPAQQAEKLEQEAKAEADNGTYTHRFKKPFTWENLTFDELTFDWGRLTGTDYLAVENEMLAQGKTLVTPEFSGDFLTGIAARACTSKLNVQTLKKMPLRNFRAILGRARSFLLRAGS